MTEQELYQKYISEKNQTGKPSEVELYKQYQDQKNEASKTGTRKARLDDFIPNMDTPEALLSGFNDGAYMGHGANATAAMTGLPENYTKNRDAVQKRYNELSNDNVLGMATGRTLGGAVPAMLMPFSKIASALGLGTELSFGQKLAQGAGDAYAQGSMMNPGNKPGETGGLQLKDRMNNGTIAALMGTGIQTGSKGVSMLPEFGDAMKTRAQKVAYDMTKPSLKSYTADTASGNDLKTGKFALDKGLIPWLGSKETVNERAKVLQSSSGEKLNTMYAEAQKKFQGDASKIGFDPIRDKSEIMAAAKQEAGDTVGSEAALKQLSDWIDSRAAVHGDAPNAAAQAKYQQEIGDYLPQFKNYLKQKKEYQGATGAAGADMSQPILSGMTDDLQRTSSKPITLEVQGKPASVMTSQELPELQYSLDQAPRIRSQMRIEGTGLTPKQTAEFTVPTVESKSGQTKMALDLPDAPNRPIKPSEVRNPMDARRMTDLKGAADDKVDYSSNPALPDKATEDVFYGARKYLSGKVDQSMEKYAESGVAGLKDANLDYGVSSKIVNSTSKDMALSSKNNNFGLGDVITGSAALAPALYTHDPKLALLSVAAVAGKKGVEKFGSGLNANIQNSLGDILSASPKLQDAVGNNPAVTNMMIQRYLMMNPKGK